MARNFASFFAAVRSVLTKSAVFSITAAALTVFGAQFYKYHRLQLSVTESIVKSGWYAVVAGGGLALAALVMSLWISAKKRTVAAEYDRMTSGQPSSEMNGKSIDEKVSACLAARALGQKEVDRFAWAAGLILSAVSLIIYLRSGPTAYEWPSIDMGPFFERTLDPGFLSNDFFANASSRPNPRFIFGYLVLFLMKLTGASWYTILYWLKGMLVTALPPLLLFALKSVSGQFLKKTTEQLWSVVFSAVFILALFSSRILGFFAPASWLPLSFAATPHAVTFFVGFVAVVLSHGRSKKAKAAAYPVWFAASLIHPVVGSLVFVFWFATLRARKFNTVLLTFVAAVIAPFGIVAALFRSPVSLDAATFVDIYVRHNHAPHYIPTLFRGFTSIPWQASFLLTAAVILGVAAHFRKKEPAISYGLCLPLLVAYVGCVAAQYAFVEAVPVKIMAVIGPSRYLLFGYWSVAAVVSLAISRLLSEVRLPELFAASRHLSARNLSLATVAVVLAAAPLLSVYKDDPFRKALSASDSFAAWIETTPKDSVFIAPWSSPLLYDLPLAFKRALFVGLGFPFREDSFVEFDERKTAIYGTFDYQKVKAAKTAWDMPNSSYRSLTPSALREIGAKRRLDYAIIESDRADAFSDLVPVYENASVKVYAIPKP